MTEPRLLVHVCCGECAAAILDPLRRFPAVTLYFHNPNIQPLLEFRRRAKSAAVLADQEKLPAIVDLHYDSKAFLAAVPWDRPDRCLACYRLRLGATARLAAEEGFTAITTTLLTSVHQDHEAVVRIGRQEAAARGLEFLDEDWRLLAPRGREEARRRHLYRQQYCGCLFSEEERFAPTKMHLYRGGSTQDAPDQGGDE